MKFRALLAAATFGLAAMTLAAEAETPVKPARIGYLTIAPRDTQTHLIQAFERGLVQHGYTPGRDVLIERKVSRVPVETSRD